MTIPGTSVARSLASLAFALVVAAGLVASPAGAPAVRAASPDLTIVSDTRYDVQPDQRRVHVTADLTLTNHLRDTKTRRYFFDTAFLAVLPGTTGYRLTSSGRHPSASVSRRVKDYTLLRLNLGGRLTSGRSARFRLQFDLPDPGGAATRDVRIGASLASFPVWAYASDGTSGGTVTVAFPAGFSVQVAGGSIPTPTKDGSGRTTFRTGRLEQPLAFFAYLVADRPGSYAEREVTSDVAGKSVPLTIRAWPDDPGWSKRVGALVGRALPQLDRAIGLDWPREGGLTIQEAVARSTGGYAGLFDPGPGTVEIAYYANDFVVLHEAAHAWFNGALLADRWANEGFASYYAGQAARALKVKAAGDRLTPALQKAHIPLNAWGAIGREASGAEDYAYAASLELAGKIAERAGNAALGRVWADAEARVGAYQPEPDSTGPAEPERVVGAPDWRGLLDLLEARTGRSFADLWRTWVVRDQDRPLLEARAGARSEYDAVVAAAGAWRLPRAIRDAMRAWQFDQAQALLAQARTVLAERDAVGQSAQQAGLTVPPTLRTVFQSDTGLDDAAAEIAAERAAIGRYAQARESRAVADQPLQRLGLLGLDPDSDLTASAAAFGAGDLAASAAAADRARAAWTSAESIGRDRAFGLLALAGAVLMGLLVAGSWLRGRRRRTRLAAPEESANVQGQEG
ncbi:MAG: hypothetical protein ACJ761_09445 [Chloroflexota bacterium]